MLDRKKGTRLKTSTRAFKFPIPKYGKNFINWSDVKREHQGTL
jgi:hypothetical protein